MKSVDAGILAHGFVADEEPPRQPLPEGTSIGPYSILSLLASGGMGDVYRARDERLGRSVALKVLPTGLTDDRERLERFAQEAKSASALNHPHIVTIYEIGQARPSCIVQPIAGTNQRQRPEEVHYIAMELIEGQTLREFNTSNPPIARRLEVLAQTAEGLGKAHAAGIVHRDLKPDNIMVSAEGYAKVVDFGLAKLVEPSNGWNPIGADSPTMRAITQQGELIGTAGYMSPEQILGKVIDQRSDVFSFGCIVYETVAGARPFTGESFVDTLHDVLHGTPPPVAHPNEYLQNELRRIIGKCIEKDREYRYQSIRDVALDLRAAAVGTTAAANIDRLVVQADGRKNLPAKRWLTAFAAAVVVAIIGWQINLRMPASAPTLPAARAALQRITTNGHVGHLAISPDGRFAAYTIYDEAAGPAVWLQQIATGSRVAILPPLPKAEYHGLAFSSDGNHLLATRYEGTIFGAVVEVPLLGGTPARLIADADTAVTPSPDGKQLAVTRDVLEKGESRLLITARDGSHERVLASLPGPEGALSPSWSPDGTQIAVPHGHTLFTIDVNTGAKKSVPIVAPGTIRDITWTTNDTLLVSAFDERLAGHWQLLRVDLGSRTVANLTDDADDYAEPRWTGKSIAAIQSKYQSAIWSVAPGSASTQLTRGLGSADGMSGLTTTRDGRVVYSSAAGGTADLWIANADGSDARQLTNDARLESHPIVTSDGKTIVYSSRVHGRSSLWRMNTDGGQQREITSAAAIYDFILSPDGKQIVYVSGDETTSRSSLISVPIEGGKAATITNAAAVLWSLQITPDGRTVIFSTLEGQAIKLFKVAIAGGAVTRLAAEGSNYSSVSPDGTLIACSYRGTQLGPAKLAILNLDGGAPLRVLDLNGRLYRWTRDGKGIIYIKHDGKQDNLFMQPLAGGPPVALTNFTDGFIANYDWSSDGKRIVLTHYIQSRDIVLLGAV
ncbi:MAG: eukaryotic-like serine/threonine-protein kinase [Thermoanaerobaculia bacterium]|jgi:Tol biopolymer transport system component|nr:eukaryotic-like serine/threonine-protein kinase [Thermoanaerobaculia bacterium]